MIVSRFATGVGTGIDKAGSHNVRVMVAEMSDSVRRFTRLTNAFSKKLENHGAHVALWFAYYNFVKVHGTIETTPAVAAGVTDHEWSMEELIEAAKARACKLTTAT